MVDRVGHRTAQRRLSCRQRAGRVDRVRETRRRITAQGLVQSRSALGRLAHRHERCHDFHGM